MTTPLLLLDVDGVLNALPDEDSDLFARQQWSDGYATSDATGWPITWAPSVIGRLRTWHQQGLVELQWLTTWGHDANHELRLLLGMPQLLVAGTYEDEGQTSTTAALVATKAHASVAPAALDPLTGQWWKYDVVRRLLAEQSDRLIIWVEDELHDPNGPYRAWAATKPNLLAVGPNPRCGLSPEDLSALDQVLTPDYVGGGAHAAP